MRYLIAAAVLGLAGSAVADTINVPADYATIQAAVDAAVDGDEVVVAPGTYTSTNAGHVIDMKGKAITLRSSQGADVTIIDGEGARRVIRFDSGETAATTIVGFSITGGSTTSSGGGIYCYESSPTISDCTISGNTATHMGGGIFCRGEPTITGCTISGNTAAYGGGVICYESSPTLSECTITGNTASETTNSDGGGAYFYHSNSTLTSCVIENNFANDNGGGIYCHDNSNPTITGCTISGNTANDDGGGISCNNSSPTLTDCVIESNTANDNGGGIFCSYSSSPTLTGCTITGNDSTYGGGIYCYESSPTLADCTISGNSVSETANSDGGGAYFYYSNSTLTSCVIENNFASDDGGGVLCRESSPTFTNCTISGNIANGWGGGIRCYDNSSPTLTGCTIANNAATGTDGGGIICNNSSPTLTDCVIESNTANDNGGGIFCSYSSSPTLTGCTITGNDSTYGGGIYCYESSPTLADCTISGNSVSETANSDGGGAYFYYSNSTLTSCVIENNFASDDGGGVLCRESSPTFTNCTISTNTASDSGGGIFCYASSSPTLSECTITGNTAGRDGGGLQAISYSYPWIVKTTICGNAPYQTHGPWINGGGVCVTFTCDDADGDGLPDKCSGIGDGVHEVPGEYATIQEAIEVAGYGDTVLVAPGTYTGTGDWVINPGGKPIIIMASGTAEETILDGEDSRHVIRCTNGESNETVIQGFTITRGWNTVDGGGIYCYGGSPTIRQCTVRANQAGDDGAGLFCLYGSPLLINNVFEANIAGDNGGGIYAVVSTLQIVDCSLSENVCVDFGGALYLEESEAFVHGCDIWDNSAGEVQGGNGIHARLGSTAVMSGVGICDKVHCRDTASIAFEAESVYEISPGLVISASGALKFDIGALDTDASLNTNVLLEPTIGSLLVTNQSESLLESSIGDVIPLVSDLTYFGSFSTVVFPPMPPDRALKLIVQSRARGGNGLAVEVIGVDTPDFSDPFAETLDGPPVDLVSFDADGDGKEELAVLFGGSPGWIAAYDISEGDPPVLLEDLIMSVGNDPVDLSVADVDGDGDDDLVIANASDSSLTLLTNEAGLMFTSSTISISEGRPTCVAFMDWDSSGSLDVAIGVEIPDEDGEVPEEDAYLTLLNVSSGAPVTGPSFVIPLALVPDGAAVSDPPAALDGGDASDMWGFCGGTQYGRIHHVTATDGLQQLAAVNAQINAIQGGDFDADGGDGHVDIAASSEEAQSLYLFQGEIAGFGDLIPISLNEPVEDFVVMDADGDGDSDIITASPTSANYPLLLLRNDGASGGALVQSLGGIVWSMQGMASGGSPHRLAGGMLNNKDDDDDWVIGGGGGLGFGGETGVLEQTNLLGDTGGCPEDIDGNGVVDIDDLLLVLGNYNGTGEGDVDGNGVVNIDDMLLVIGAWNASC